MDGFDDLLNTSHANPILENPFEDPFARPRSPDPWSTFSPQSGPDKEHAAGVDHPHESQSSVHPPTDLPSTEEAISEPVDPLDAKAANEEDDVEDQPPRLQLLGSSASHSSPVASQIPSAAENHATASVSGPVSHPVLPSPVREASPPPPTPSAESPKTPTSPQQQHPSPNQPSAPLPPSSEVKSSTPISAEFPQQSTQPTPMPTRPSVISPLDGGSTSGQPSFATLALCGEMPGWQGTNTIQTRASHHIDASGSGGWGEHGHEEEFVNGAQRIDDDDDDDLPIAVWSHLPFHPFH
jgi:sorting nexin-1/2